MRMHEPFTRRLYDLWAFFYDATFGALVHRRQRRAMQELPAEPGQRVLDLGVGTGMTLPHYPEGVEAVGMDLSPGMLEKARRKCAEAQLPHRLVQGDAMHPPFAKEVFDHVLVTHTVSVVSDPPRLMRGARRMVKPGGRVIVLNHFRSTHPVMGWLERKLNPLFVHIGWRSDLGLEELLEGLDLHFEYAFQLRSLDLWKIVVLSSPSEGAGDAAETGPAAPPTA